MDLRKNRIGNLFMVMLLCTIAFSWTVWISEEAKGGYLIDEHGDNLVGYWNFDEGSGTKVVDSSPNHNNGTISGASWSEKGMVNGSMYFDGSDDYVNIPNDPTLQITDKISILAWIRFEKGGNWMPRIVHKQSSYQILTEDTSSERYLIFILNQNPSKQVYSTFKLQSNVWYHIGATYDKSDMKLYINGEFDNSTSYSSNIAKTTYPVRIGSNSYNGLDDFKGNIDEVHILNKSLDGEDVSNYYNSTKRNYHYWDLDEGSGQTAYDSGNPVMDLRLGNTSNNDTSDPEWARTPFGKGLHFDGQDDHAITSTNISIKGNSSRTIATWFYVDDFIPYSTKLGGVMQLVSWGIPKGTKPIQSQIMVRSKEKSVIFNGNYADIDSPDNSIKSETWYHVLFTYNGTRGYLYLNGSLVGSKNLNLNTSDTTLRLGLNPNHTAGGWNAPFDGTIDEVMVSDDFMNNSDVKDFYESYKKNDSIYHYWDFDEGSGQTAYDEGSPKLELMLGSTNSSDSNDPTWVSTPFGKGLKYDGANDYSITKSNINITGNSSRTMSAWFNIEDYDFYSDKYEVMNLISWGKSGSSNDNCELMVKTYDKCLFLGIDYHNELESNKNTILIGNWYHALFSYDGTKGYLYLNGKEVDNQSFTFNTTNTQFRIGLDPVEPAGGWNAPFDGIIDEVLVSDDYMNPSEVKNFYESYDFSQNRTSINVSLASESYEPDQKASITVNVRNPLSDYDSLSVEMKYFKSNGTLYYIGNATYPLMERFALTFDIPSDIEEGTYKLHVKVCGFHSDTFVWSDTDITYFEINGENIHENFNELNDSLEYIWKDIKEMMKWNVTFEELKNKISSIQMNITSIKDSNAVLMNTLNVNFSSLTEKMSTVEFNLLNKVDDESEEMRILMIQRFDSVDLKLSEIWTFLGTINTNMTDSVQYLHSELTEEIAQNFEELSLDVDDIESMILEDQALLNDYLRSRFDIIELMIDLLNQTVISENEKIQEELDDLNNLIEIRMFQVVEYLESINLTMKNDLLVSINQMQALSILNGNLNKDTLKNLTMTIKTIIYSLKQMETEDSSELISNLENLLKIIEDKNGEISDHLVNIDRVIEEINGLDVIIEDLDSLDKQMDSDQEDLESKDSNIQVTNYLILILLIVIISLVVYAFIFKGIRKEDG